MVCPVMNAVLLARVRAESRRRGVKRREEKKKKTTPCDVRRGGEINKIKGNDR